MSSNSQRVTHRGHTCTVSFCFPGSTLVISLPHTEILFFSAEKSRSASKAASAPWQRTRASPSLHPPQVPAGLAIVHHSERGGDPFLLPSVSPPLLLPVPPPSPHLLHRDTADCCVQGGDRHHSSFFCHMTLGWVLSSFIQETNSPVHINSQETMPGDWLHCWVSMSNVYLVSCEAPQLGVSLWCHSFGLKLRPCRIIDYVFIGP